MLLKECLVVLRDELGQYEAETILLYCLQQNNCRQSNCQQHGVLNVPQKRFDRAYLIRHDQMVLSDHVLTMVHNIVRRRRESIPLAYILGYCYFYNLQLIVNRNTLVPRPDTEILVDIVIDQLQRACQDFVKNTPLRCLDLGTGSGAIILALKQHMPQIQAYGIDVCYRALEVAQRNARRLQCHIFFVQGSWAESIAISSFDCVVSNPPYVAYSELSYMNASAGAEPVSALFASNHGLSDYCLILKQAYHCLKPKGWLCVEHGFQQAEAVAHLFTEHGFVGIQQKQDYSGYDRVTIGQKPAFKNVNTYR